MKYWTLGRILLNVLQWACFAAGVYFLSHKLWFIGGVSFGLYGGLNFKEGLDVGYDMAIRHMGGSR